MPTTVDQAILKIQEFMPGEYSLGNVLDGIIGVNINNAGELQAYLNELLKKKGVLSAQDEAVLNQLLAQQEAERKKRQTIRIKNAVIIGAMALAFGGMIYFLVKKK